MHRTAVLSVVFNNQQITNLHMLRIFSIQQGYYATKNVKLALTVIQKAVWDVVRDCHYHVISMCKEYMHNAYNYFSRTTSVNQKSLVKRN